MAAPPRAIEMLVAFLLPPVCREHVLGDLHERCSGVAQYIMEALRTVPLVIASQIRRTTDVVVLFMEAGVLYSAFAAAASFLDPALLTDERGLLRLAIPPAIVLAALVLIDAYADPRKRSPLRPIPGAALAVGFALLSQALPQRIMIAGGSISILLISAMRMLFPPVSDRPQGVNVPAYWQKQAVEPVAAKAIVAAGVVIVITLLIAYQLGK